MLDRAYGPRDNAGGMKYERFEDLPVWQAAVELAPRVYRLTRAGKKEAASDPETLRRIWDRSKACED